MPVDKNLFDEYLETKKKFDLLKDKVFSQIRNICKLCTGISPGESITGFCFNDEPECLDEPEVLVDVTSYNFGDDTYCFPKRYLDMTLDEIKADVERMKKLEEEEEQRVKEKAEYRQYLRLKKRFEKKDIEKDEGYKKYLEPKAEFEGAGESPATRGVGGAPVKESVWLCKYWEHDDDDPSGCGETWQWCNSEKSGRRECECKRTYAMQFCPFYKKGKLAGKWVINDADKQAAEEFKKKFEGKELKAGGL